MRRRLAVSLFAISLAILLVAPLVSSEAQPARGPRRTTAGLVAHEWGVWKIRRTAAGTYEEEHLEALAAETPAFVFRGGRPGTPPPPFQPPAPNPPPPQPPRPQPQPQPWIPPRPNPGPGPVARKPVLFFYTDRPTDVTVRVAFRDGGPWLFYPSAMETTAPDVTPRSNALTWVGRVQPRARATFPAAPRGHWWNDLRNVGAATFFDRGGQHAERFLFYDGPVAFQPAFRLEANGTPTPTVGNVGWHRVVRRGDDMRALRRELETALVAAGLTRRETRSLTETWRDELFGANANDRFLYLVPRNLYDTMLPITITPTPTSLVRVGLVIEEINPVVAAGP